MGDIFLTIAIVVLLGLTFVIARITDKNNKAQYSYPFPMVSATATVIGIKDGKFLLGLRGSDNEAFPNTYCFPGGFLNAKTKKSGGETLEHTAVREFKEETNIGITKNRLNLMYVDSNPLTDPRGHVINTCFMVELSDDDVANMMAGDDIEELRWVDPNEFDTIDWAFNHEFIASLAYTKTI